ncbi:MAG: SH3 domain-containing protein [Bryobacteraceae bacterium]|nr:SH3 domain-containing protein [Bryobacteraceae bacterium]
MLAVTEPAVRPSITLAKLPELARILRLGVARDSGDFIAPYPFVTFPKNLDAFTHAVAIRPAVKVRKTPAGALVETLDYDIVVLLGPPKNGWIEVQTPSGKTGWVLRSEVWAQFEHRVFFEKKSGGSPDFWWAIKRKGRPLRAALFFVPRVKLS